MPEKRKKEEKGKQEVDKQRRTFIKALGASSGALVLGGLSLERFISPTTRDTPLLSSYPTAVLVDSQRNPIKASDIPTATASSSTYPIMMFNYPLQDEPNILVKLSGLSTPIPGAVKLPTGEYVTAFSGICQHLGCIVPLLDYHPHQSIPFEAKLIGYNETNWPAFGLLFCKCHGSQYDPTLGPHNLYNSGPAPSPANHSLPQVILTVDADGIVYATGMNPVNAVIRSHLWEPGGQEYGAGVEAENLSGGSLLPEYDGPPLALSSSVSGPIYKTIVVSSANGPWPSK